MQEALLFTRKYFVKTEIKRPEKPLKKFLLFIALADRLPTSESFALEQQKVPPMMFQPDDDDDKVTPVIGCCYCRHVMLALITSFVGPIFLWFFLVLLLL